jgi:hypothetical protein
MKKYNCVMASSGKISEPNTKTSKLNNSHYRRTISVYLLQGISASCISVLLPGNIALGKSSLLGAEITHYKTTR